MNDYRSLSHTKWDCKYHVVFIPKYRKKQLYLQIRQYLGEIFHDLARQRERRIEEGFARAFGHFSPIGGMPIESVYAVTHCQILICVWTPVQRRFDVAGLTCKAPMLISIPPKYSVSQVVGFLQGKSAIGIARTYLGRRRNFTGQSFWARSYFVSMVDADEQIIRNYINNQEASDQRLDDLDQGKLF